MGRLSRDEHIVSSIILWLNDMNIGIQGIPVESKMKRKEKEKEKTQTDLSSWTGHE